MSTIHPWQLFVVTVAGWINRYQHDIIDYLVDENRVLKGQLRGRRLRLSDEERRRLAVKGASAIKCCWVWFNLLCQSSLHDVLPSKDLKTRNAFITQCRKMAYPESSNT